MDETVLAGLRAQTNNVCVHRERACVVESVSPHKAMLAIAVAATVHAKVGHPANKENAPVHRERHSAMESV